MKVIPNPLGHEKTEKFHLSGVNEHIISDTHFHFISGVYLK